MDFNASFTHQCHYFMTSRGNTHDMKVGNMN